jgi:transcriptional regulator with XRE-family HTH domain
MATRPAPARTRNAAQSLGEHPRSWRKLQSLTIDQLVARAGVNRETVSRLEQGDLGVGIGTLLHVARALGLLESLVTALDPCETDRGRAREELRVGGYWNSACPTPVWANGTRRE